VVFRQGRSEATFAELHAEVCDADCIILDGSDENMEPEGLLACGIKLAGRCVRISRENKGSLEIHIDNHGELRCENCVHPGLIALNLKRCALACRRP